MHRALEETIASGLDRQLKRFEEDADELFACAEETLSLLGARYMIYGACYGISHALAPTYGIDPGFYPVSPDS